MGSKCHIETAAGLCLSRSSGYPRTAPKQIFVACPTDESRRDLDAQQRIRGRRRACLLRAGNQGQGHDRRTGSDRGRSHARIARNGMAGARVLAVSVWHTKLQPALTPCHLKGLCGLLQVDGMPGSATWSPRPVPPLIRGADPRQASFSAEREAALATGGYVQRALSFWARLVEVGLSSSPRLAAPPHGLPPPRRRQTSRCHPFAAQQ